MKKLSRKWLVALAEWRGWPISESYIDRLNIQLPLEFESLTGKVFNRKLFHLDVDGENVLEYFHAEDVPFGRIKGSLLLAGSNSIDIGFKWFDPSSRLLYRIEDDISQSEVEFHWIDLPVDSWEISRLKEYKLHDIREHNEFDVSFPVLSYSKAIGTDISFNIKLKDNGAQGDFLNILLAAQNEWNNQSDENGNCAKGIIHSVRFSHENEEGQSVFPIDIGSATEEVFKFLLERLNESNISIQELEIENG